MKTFYSFSLSLLLVFVFINLNGQNQVNDLKSIKAFKQQLLKEATFNNAVPVRSKNMLKQNYKRGVTDYGNPPGLNWIGQFGGSGFDKVNAVISDSLGNIYITGSFSGEMSLSGSSYTTTGDREAFVAKFDDEGNLIWLTQIPATEHHETFSKAMCMDTDGNFYITGYYTGSVTISESDLPDMNNKTLFYAKLNNQGELLKGTYHNSGENPEIGFSIGIDNDNNVYLIGAISTSLDSRHPSNLLKYDDSFNLISENYFYVGFNNLKISDDKIYYSGVIQNGDNGYLDENVTLPPTFIFNDVFVAKSNLDGVFEWGYTASHPDGYWGDSQDYCLVKDNNGNFFLAGSFRRSLIFGNDTIINYGNPQGFITKFDSLGNFKWLNQFGENLYYPAISSDLEGNVYVKGNYSILKFDTDGNQTLEKDIENKPSALFVNENDKIISSGTTKKGLIYITQFDNNVTKEWTDEFDGNSAESWLIGMVTDTAGNVYSYNYTSNTIDFFGATVNRGIFICKQNGSGEVDWIKHFPDTKVYSGYGNYIAIDPENKNIYITGTFNQDMIIPGETTLTPGENGSTFIIKYDVDGNYKWAKQEDFTGGDLCLTADYDDNVLLSGTFNADTIAIGDTELLNAGEYQDCFIAKYDVSGNLVWAKRAGGEDVEYSGLVSTDENNNVYFTGEFTSENILFDNAEYSMPEGSGNIIFVKMSPDGTIQFIKSFAASQNPDEYWDWYCWPTGIKADINGNTYIKGTFGKWAYFDDIYLENSLSRRNKFITKIDSNGNALWAKSIKPHQKLIYNYDYNQFDIDKKGSVYFGMQAKDTLDFENDYQYIPFSGNDEIITKYSNNGNLVWVKAMQGNETDRNWLSSIAVYDTTNVFAGGWFRNFLSIDGNDMLSINRYGFIVMLGEDINNGIFKEVYNSTKINIYPNPAKDEITISSDTPLPNAKIEIYTVSGKLIKTSVPDNNRIGINELSPGSYLIKIYNNKEVMTGKFIKL